MAKSFKKKRNEEDKVGSSMDIETEFIGTNLCPTSRVYTHTHTQQISSTHYTV